MKRIALVVGGTRGLGAAFVDHLGASGSWNVHATSRKPVTARNGEVSWLRLDACKKDDILQMGRVLSETRLDLVVLNAGVNNDPPMRAEYQAEWKHVYEVNALAALYIAIALKPSLGLSPDPTFLYIGARDASIGLRQSGVSAYAASKAGANALIRGVNDLLSMPRLRALAISPGWVRTEMGGNEAPDDASSSAETILALALNPKVDCPAFLAKTGEVIPW